MKEYMSSRHQSIENGIKYKCEISKKALEYISEQVENSNYEDALARTIRLMEDLCTIQSSILHSKWEAFGSNDKDD